MMDRRQFLKNLMIGVAGLYVPKTLYFDMKPKYKYPVGYNPVLIDLIRNRTPDLIALDVIGVQPMSEPIGLIRVLREKSPAPNGEEIRRMRDLVRSYKPKFVYDVNTRQVTDNWFTTFPDDHD